MDITIKKWYWMLIALAIIVIAFAVASHAQELPENPQPQKPEVRKVHLWTFRGSVLDKDGHRKFDVNAPALRTNKQTLRDPWFLAVSGAEIASMSVACSRHKTSGEDWHSEAPAVGAEVALGYFLTRYLDELYHVGMGAYVVQHYVRTAAK